MSPSSPTRVPPANRPAESHAMLLTAGQIIGDHYQLNKLIGRGGFGEVWHAVDLRGSIDKAVKVLTRSADSEEAQKELESLNIIKKINHPCLLRTESYFVEKDRLLIVLELADATLRDLLKKAQKEKQTGIPTDALLTFMRHAAEGLDYLHKQGILHRDVKPENILLVGDYAKMADFGLAKEAHNKQSTKADFAGTVVYSAPETWDGRVTTRSDQYSLAATYFELRTGRILFGGKTFQEVFFKHMEGRPDLNPLPELEQDVLRTALSKRPEERYTTCTMFVRELVDAVLASGSKTVESKPKPSEGGRTTDKAPGTLASTPPLDSLGAYVTKPPSKPGQKWNPSPGTAKPRRSRRGMRGIVVAAVAVLAIGGVLATGYSAQASLDQTVDEKLATGDFEGAVESVDNSSVFTLPFRSAIRDRIRQRAIAAIQDLGPNADDDNVEKTCRGVLRAFGDDPLAGDRLVKLYQRQVPHLVNLGEFTKALDKARLVPDAKARAELAAKVREPWLAKAWDMVLEEGRPADGKTLISDLRKAEPELPAARELTDFADAELKSDASLKDGNHREALSQLPTTGPAALATEIQARLAQRRAAIKRAWLDSVQAAKDDPRKFELASDYLDEFPRDVDAVAAQRAALPGAMHPHTQAGRFAEARKLLERAGSPAEHVKSLAIAWREKADEHFNKNTVADKDAGLAELSAAASALPAEKSLKDAVKHRKEELARYLAAKVPAAIDAKDIDRAKSLVDRARMLAGADALSPDPAVEAAGLIVFLETDRPTAGTYLTVSTKLGKSLKAPDPLLERLAGSLAQRCADDRMLYEQVKNDFAKMTERLPNWTPPASFAKAFPPKLTPDRERLQDATRLLAADLPKGREEMLKFNIGKITDEAARREGRAALVKLIDAGGYDRDQLRRLDAVSAQSPEVKTAVESAMTVKLKNAASEWPGSAQAWRERLDDCDRANPKDLVVRAMKAEALLQTGGDVKEQIPPGGDVPYLNYVRARIWDKDGDSARAAAAVMTVPPGELAPERKTLAAAMLQNAALALTPEKDGRRQVFSSVTSADNAFDWHARALDLFGRPFDAAGVLTAPLALNYALAAACKKEPDFPINKAAGDLFLKSDDKNAADALLLALSNPSAFAKQLRPDARPADVAAVRNLGEVQRKASPENTELRQRQAKLSYLLGRALDRAGADPADVQTADAAAFALEAGDPEYKTAVGRDDAVMALALSNTIADPKERIAALREGLTKSAPADQSDAAAAEMWPDLQRARAEIYVQIARASDKADAQKAFDMALAAVKKVAGPPYPEDVDFVLGQALEGLAYQCGVDGEKNYAAAVKAYRDASARKTPYAFTYGRCLVRWATDDALDLAREKKKELLANAVVEFDRVLKLKGFNMPAQAHYWKGVAIWTPYNPTLTVPAAKDALIRSLDSSADQPQREGYLAPAALRMLVAMTGYHLKSSPEMTANWLLEAEKSVESLARNAASAELSGAVREYRDLLADASAHSARRYLHAPNGSKLFTPNYAKYQTQMDRAVSLKHSKRHAEYAVERAVDFKKNQSEFGLSEAELNAARDVAASAVENASPIERTPLKKRLDDGWR